MFASSGRQHIRRRRAEGAIACAAAATLLLVGCGKSVTGSAIAVSGSTAASSTSPQTNSPAPESSAAAAALMSKIRAVDPCSLIDADFPKQFGVVTVGRTDLERMPDCAVESMEGENVRARFRLQLGRQGDTPGPTQDTLDGHPIRLSKPTRSANVNNAGFITDTCDVDLPLDVPSFSDRLHVLRFWPQGQEPPSESEACDLGKQYLHTMLGKIEALPAGWPPAQQGPKYLWSKDPCAAIDDIVGGLPGGGWKKGSANWMSPYSCVVPVSSPASKVDATIELDFKRDKVQVPGPSGHLINVAGKSGIEIPLVIDPIEEGLPPADGGCLVDVTFTPPETPDGIAHLITANINFTAKGAADGSAKDSYIANLPMPFPTCQQSERAVTAMVAKAGG